MAFIIPFIPLIASGISAAVAGVELTNQPSAQSSAQSSQIQAPTQQQSNTQQAQAQQAAALAQAQALTKRRGMASTVLTSPMGVNSGPSETKVATLGT
jgi:phage protein D